MNSSIIKSEPYKGAYSYQIEDASLFYGRERETGHLVAKVLGSRFTLLHARSGAGKSSLLNARLIPKLESRGWTVIRAEPGDNPTLSLQSSVLRSLLPTPDAELVCIRKCMEHFPDTKSLSSLLEAYDQLGVRDSRRRELVQPVTVSEIPGLFSENDTVRPVFCKLLLSNITVQSYCAHLGAISESFPGCLNLQDVDPDDLDIATIISLLESDEYRSAYSNLTSQLISKSGSLTDFFASVIGNYGSHIRDFALVVILDQFEELFTRFVDPGIIRTRTSSQALDWKLRREFFNQYGSLFEYRIPSDNPEIPVGDHLPIRYVISMRDDFLAQLEDLRKIVGPLEDNMYHLNMLEPGDATDALREPARQFGYDYSENCVNRIVSDLTREERFVEPAHLSIVCSRLWDAYGRKISEGSYTGQADIDKLIHEAEFAELGGAAGIISSFFKSFLTGLNMDERLETVELLSRLITGAGTRNIVEQSALVNAPYRDCERRRMLLDNLIKNHGIVRAEYRFGGRFISITHEFLIEPIQEAEHELLASNIEC
jgi:hypothetical protein